MRIETKLELTSDQFRDICSQYKVESQHLLDENPFVSVSVCRCKHTLGIAMEPTTFLVRIEPKNGYDFNRSITIIQTNSDLNNRLRYELQPQHAPKATAWERDTQNPSPSPTHVVLSFIDYSVVPSLERHIPDLSALELSVPLT